MRQYEYENKTITLKSDFDSWLPGLNDLGRDGWLLIGELQKGVHAVYGDVGIHYFGLFVREVSDTKSSHETPKTPQRVVGKRLYGSSN